MEILHTILWVLYYGFGIIFLAYEAAQAVKKRRQEKEFAETLDKLDKLFDKSKLLDK